MAFKNIVVPYDGSNPSRSALEIAKDLVGADPEATLHVMSVMTVPSDPFHTRPLASEALADYMLVEPDLYERAFRENVKHMRDDLKAELASTLEDLTCEVVVDVMPDLTPVEGVAAYVRRHDCDLVVMGRRGLGAVRGLIGSVSFGVLRAVNVPVMTVK